MQQTALWEGKTCPLCESQGINSKLKFFRLNLREAALLCKRKKCPFPLSTNYPDTFVRVDQDGNIIPGSQSERGWQHEGEADSDDSPYISDSSEESVQFPDTIPEVKSVHNFSSGKTSEKGVMEMDAFDISNIDFETEDSLDIFKLQNEITSLEMEITKSVENMKSVLPHVNCKDSSVLNKNNESSINSVSVAARASTSADDKVCTDTHKELDISGTNYVKVNENGMKWYNYGKSGDIILREHDSLTGILGSLELSKMGEELTNCVQQSDVSSPVSNECILNHKHGGAQNNNNRNFRDEGCTDDGDHGGGLDDVRSITSSDCRDVNVEKQIDTFTMADPKASILLIAQDTKNAVGNDLPRACEIHSESTSNKSVTFIKDICESEISDNKEVVVFNDHKNSDCSDINVRKQFDVVPIPDTSNTEHESSVFLTPETTKHTVGSSFPRKCELVSCETVSIKEDNECRKEISDDNEVVIVFNDQKNIDCDENEGKQLLTVSMVDFSNPEPEPSVLTSQCMKNTVGTDLPVKHEILVDLVNSESVTIKKDDDFKKEMCDGEEVFVIFNDHKNNDYSDDNVEEHAYTVSMADTSNPDPEPSFSLTSQCVKSTVGNSLSGKHELLTELVASIKTDNDCGKEKDGINEMFIISDGSNNIAEKQLNTICKADTSHPRPNQHELLAKLIGSETVPTKKANDSNKTFDNSKVDIVLTGNKNSDMYEIVAIENGVSPTTSYNDSRNYEVINLQLKFCDNPESRGGNARRKYTRVRQKVKNTVDQLGKGKGGAWSDSEIFRYAKNNASPSVSAEEKTNQYRQTHKKTVHSANCVCFLCSESNGKGITSHLDRALADLFPEEYFTEKRFTESELPTEKEVMRDFVQYITGNSSLQNNRSPKKRKRLLHL